MYFAGVEWSAKVWEPEEVIRRMIDRLPDEMVPE